MARKIVQMFAMVSGSLEDGDGYTWSQLYTLCDDNSIWFLEVVTTTDPHSWHWTRWEVPPIPQDSLDG